MQASLTVLTVLSVMASLTAAQPLVLAGVPFGTNVSEHTKIDLDIKRVQDLLAAGDDTLAKTIYENGENSRKSSSMRTLRGFSTPTYTDPTNVLFSTYYVSEAFEDDFVQSAFASSGPFQGKDLPTRAAAITTAIKTMNTWMYVIHEMEDGLEDCQDKPTDGDVYIGGPVNSMDEAWAFWTGSLEGKLIVGSPNGVGLFRLAVDMCTVFNTCVPLPGGAKASPINIQIAGNLSVLAQAIQRDVAPCPQSRAYINTIINRMRVPLVQGLISNVFSSAKAATTGDRDKFWASAWAFYGSIAPFVKRCAPSVDTQLRAVLSTPGYNVTVAQTITAAIESTYLCMGLTCADVGNLGADQRVCTDRTLAGYDFRSNVMDRAFLDLDLQRISELLRGNDFDGALALYQSGAHSVRSNGVIRTVAGLSINHAGMVEEPVWKLFTQYYNNDLTYGNTFVINALTGVSPKTTENPVMRREVALKSMQYLILWNYIIHELEESIVKCQSAIADGIDARDGDVIVDVDEAWAFFTGSLLWGSGSTSDAGYMMFSTNLKRCKEFKTCTNADKITGRALANDRTMAAMASMQAASELKDCTTMASSLDKIKAQMRVPLIQGLLKYVYLADRKVTTNPSNDLRKEWAEGYSFYAAVAPFIAQCDASVDALIKRNIGLNVNPNELMKDGYVAVSNALQSTFDCLKVSCSEIGSIHASVQCNDPIPPFALNYAGYRLITDVTDRGRVDLDMKEISSLMSLGTFEAAEAIYRNGKNSVKSNGQMRNLYSLSSDFNKFANESTWNLFFNYYSSPNFADSLILAALGNKSPFDTKPAIVRREVALKVMQYTTMLNYIMHELEEANKDCKDGVASGAVDVNDGDRAVDVDEAWAFFTGSLHVPNATSTGYLFYNANMKRCKEYKTCVSGSTRALANDRALASFVVAQAAAEARDCKTLQDSIYKIRSQMLVPIIQGMLKYAYLMDKSDPNKPLASPGSELQKEWAEGFAFAYAALPFLNHCDKNVASLVRQNMWITSSTPMQSGSDAVIKAVQSTFTCLNITCAEVSAFVESSRCTDSLSSGTDSSDLSGGAIAGIVIACVVFYGISLFFCFWRGKKSGAEAGNQTYSIEANKKAAAAAANGTGNGNGNGTGNGNGNGNGKAGMEQIEVV